MSVPAANSATDLAAALLLHSVWQGFALGALYLVAMVLLARAAPRARYAVAVFCLLGFIVAPLVTLALLVSGAKPLPAAAVPHAMLTALTDSTTALAPLAVRVWLLGVMVLGARLAWQWRRTRRLLRHGCEPLPHGWDATVATLVAQMSVSRPVRVVESVLIAVPTVIGWLRPVILIPTSAMLGLTSRQLELVIAHELAHIRRHDYVVNYLLLLIETLCFYHPAVYLIGRGVRHERELCCDDLVVARCGSRLEYATALTQLETLRSHDALLGNNAGVAATGGDLYQRVRRIVRSVPASVGSSRIGVPAVVFALLFAVALVPVLWRLPARMDAAPAGVHAPSDGAVNDPSVATGDIASRDDGMPDTTAAQGPGAVMDVAELQTAAPAVDDVTPGAGRLVAETAAPPTGRERQSASNSAAESADATVDATALRKRSLAQSDGVAPSATRETQPVSAISADASTSGDAAVETTRVPGTSTRSAVVGDSAFPASKPAATGPDAGPAVASVRDDTASAHRPARGDAPATGSVTRTGVARQDNGVPEAHPGVTNSRPEVAPGGPTHVIKDALNLPEQRRESIDDLRRNAGRALAVNRSPYVIVPPDQDEDDFIVADYRSSLAREEGGELIRRIEPRYPSRARLRGFTDTVQVEFRVTGSGRVRDVVVVTASSRASFERAVVRAVRKWRYEPLLRDGVPVERTVVETFAFRLEPTVERESSGVGCRLVEGNVFSCQSPGLNRVL